ncbi:hypothetical protein B0H14DRAFT_3476239 [Mycena olivaceomarginata]|nr:hypothetical protein B0H14DRAFT_3476239 [Mycena olivaceomarginata]
MRVRLFERDDVPGGNWHYTDETPLDAPIPNGDPVVGGFVPSFPSHWDSLPVEEHYSNEILVTAAGAVTDTGYRFETQKA